MSSGTGRLVGYATVDASGNTTQRWIQSPLDPDRFLPERRAAALRVSASTGDRVFELRLGALVQAEEPATHDIVRLEVWSAGHQVMSQFIPEHPDDLATIRQRAEAIAAETGGDVIEVRRLTKRAVA